MYEQTQNDYGNMNVVVSTTCMNTDSLTHRSHMGEPEDQRKMGALAFFSSLSLNVNIRNRSFW